MEIKLETHKTRLEQLKLDQLKIVAQANAISGAIQLLEQIIAELESPEPEVKDKE